MPIENFRYQTRLAEIIVRKGPSSSGDSAGDEGGRYFIRTVRFNEEAKLQYVKQQEKEGFTSEAYILRNRRT